MAQDSGPAVRCGCPWRWQRTYQRQLPEM